MLQALLRTLTELLDSKKAAYSILATVIAIVLHLQFGVSPENALLLVSPLGVATMAQAHVDAKRSLLPGTPSAPTASSSNSASGTLPGTPNAMQG